MIFQDVQEMDENGSWHATFQRLNIKAKSNAGSQKVGKSAENRIYNRYRDVVPYDHSLVPLRNSDTEYINANFVKVQSIGKEYILTQGPLANTCNHFWQMIWEQNTYSVVMLNRVVEKNQLKCHQYWPLQGSLTAGDINVTVIEEDNHNEFIVRVLELEHLKEGSKRSIRHFHYVAWPDFGVPSSPQAFLKYLLAVQEYQSSVQGVGPAVVHCSAGIGRSGTFALIDAALTEIQQKNDMISYDVKAQLLEMRTYRPGLIQTAEQLHFSYIAILEGANMVAPSAYSNAYYSVMPGEYVEEYEDEEEDEDRPGKRRADGEQDDGEQPGAKERRKEPIAAVTESESESESGEDEQVSLSDIDARLNDGNEQPGDDRNEAGEENKETGGANEEAGEENKEAGDNNEEAGDETSEEGGDDNAQPEHLGSPEAAIEATSSETVPDRVKKQADHDIEASKGDTIGQEQQKRGPVVDTSTEKPKTVSEKSDCHNEHCKFPKLGDDSNGQVPSQSSICSGRFPSDFNVTSSEDAETSSGDIAASSQSVEKVVNRWQSSEDCEGTDCNEPRPKRSAIRRNSLEGGKRKSVTFVSTVNGEASEDTLDKDSAGYVEEKDTESSNVRRRQVDERKRNLANKVDEIKKKMKNSEQNEDSSNSTMIGLVICVAVVGFAYFYYYFL